MSFQQMPHHYLSVSELISTQCGVIKKEWKPPIRPLQIV
jgi:hypothetical protein